jgi:hypothetical protein
MTHAGGRPKKTYDDGLTIKQWLKGFLSGGPQLSGEIKRVAEARGAKWHTVTRAKKELGCFISEKVGHDWQWRDSTVAVKPKAGDKLDRDRKFDDAKVDEDGFSRESPQRLGLKPSSFVMTLDHVREEILCAIEQGRDRVEISETTFAWAYPAAGLSESTIKELLVSHGLPAPRRVPVVGPDSNDPESTTEPGEDGGELPF